ncbi:putative redox-active protein [anaerobic digester metagenome]
MVNSQKHLMFAADQLPVMPKNVKLHAKKMERQNKAIELFRSGLSCAQAILMAYGPDLDLPESVASRLGSGLGGGIGRSQEVCGAINAAAMMLSMKYGNSQPDDLESKDRAAERVSQFMKQAAAEFGGVTCMRIVGFNMFTPEGKQKAARLDVHKMICEHIVTRVAAILDEQIAKK